MRFTQLSIQSVRNLADISLKCHPGCNIIYGKNAAGKTAILEAIHILARISSFRTPKITEVIQRSQDKLTVSAELQDRMDRAIKTGLEKGRLKTRIRFNGHKVLRRSEQARNIPLLTITPESHRLLFGTPRERRHWLDWSLFHVEQGYIRHWQDYHHALRQRNILLRKSVRGEQLDPWEKALSVSAAPIIVARNRYLQRLELTLGQYTGEEVMPVELKYTGTEETEEAYARKLRDNRQSDSKAGHTQLGPHRDDIHFQQGKHNIGSIFSRGQAKQFIVSLTLAQADVYRRACKVSPIMLVDDLTAELDLDALQFILARLQGQDMQVFITTTSLEPLSLTKKGRDMGVFHVEHGKVVKVVE